MFAEAERGLRSWAELLLFLQLAGRAAGLSFLHGVEQCSRRLSVAALWLKKQRFVCPRHYVWNPQGSIWNSCPPPVSTNILPGAWLKIIHMPAFWPGPKCFKIIYVPITLHYFLAKDLISLQRWIQYNLGHFKAVTRICIWGTYFKKDTAYHLEPSRIYEIKCFGEAQRFVWSCYKR